mgnify:CR=1 FL=1
MRFRYVSMLVGSIAAAIMIFLTDPDLFSIIQLPFGARAFVLIKSLLMISVAAAMVHYVRKTLFDYFDLAEALKEAMKGPTGAGLAIIGIAVMVLAASVTFVSLAQLVI